MANKSNLLNTEGKQTHRDIQSEALEMIDHMVLRTKCEKRVDTVDAKKMLANWLYSQIGVANLNKSFRQLSTQEYEKAIAACFPYCKNMYDIWNT